MRGGLAAGSLRSGLLSPAPTVPGKAGDTDAESGKAGWFGRGDLAGIAEKGISYRICGTKLVIAWLSWKRGVGHAVAPRNAYFDKGNGIGRRSSGKGLHQRVYVGDIS